MKSAVITAQLKNPDFAEKIEKIYDDFISSASGALKGCKGGIVLKNQDGSLMDISLWTSEEDALSSMKSPKTADFIKTFEDNILNTYTMDFYDVSMKLNMYSRSQKPVALVIKGKFKTFASMQSAVKTEKFLSRWVNFINCKGGLLLTKDDGSFIDISLWENMEYARKIMENPLSRIIVKFFDGSLEKPYKPEYYDVSMILDIPDKDEKRDFRILYFSGTGNTHWVVNKIKEGLLKNNHSCEVLEAARLQNECGRDFNKKPDENMLKQKLSEFIPENSTLILAFPCYASDIPLPVKELIPLLPEGGKRKLATVSTILMVGGDAVNLPGEMVREKGYKSVLATYVLMPNNLKVPKFDFFDIKNGDELNSYYETAGRAVDEIVEELLTGKVLFEGKNLGGYAIGVSQRMGVKYLESFMAANLFAHARCTRCGFCAETCPMANITFEKKYPEFGRNCCMCLRCYNLCPVNAIQITGETLNEEKYKRYKGFDRWKPERLRKVK